MTSDPYAPSRRTTEGRVYNLTGGDWDEVLSRVSGDDPLLGGLAEALREGVPVLAGDRVDGALGGLPRRRRRVGEGAGVGSGHE